MHIHQDHLGGHSHDHEHSHTHEHTHGGVTHTHEHTHEHSHEHMHPHSHDQLHQGGEGHNHSHGCEGNCGSCGSQCAHTPMEELLALMTYMANHNTAHANELAQLAKQLEETCGHAAYEQVMAAVSDYEKGNLRLRAVLASLQK